MAQKSTSFWNLIGCFLQVILAEHYQGFISIKAPKITRQWQNAIKMLHQCYTNEQILFQSA